MSRRPNRIVDKERIDRIKALETELESLKKELKKAKFVTYDHEHKAVSSIRVKAFENAAAPMFHHPFFLFGNDLLFNSTGGRILAITYGQFAFAILNAFSFFFAMSLHAYVQYEISLTDYISHGKLIQMIFGLIFLVMLTIVIGLSRACLERKLHGSLDNLLDKRVQNTMLMAQTAAAGG